MWSKRQFSVQDSEVKMYSFHAFQWSQLSCHFNSNGYNSQCGLLSGWPPTRLKVSRWSLQALHCKTHVFRMGNYMSLAHANSFTCIFYMLQIILQKMLCIHKHCTSRDHILLKVLPFISFLFKIGNINTFFSLIKANVGLRQINSKEY